MTFCSRVGNISIEKFEVTPVVQNCRILSTEGKAVVIDTGGDADLIIRKLEEKKLVL
ncbi:MAG: hypothetical protein NZO16_01185 [Deltaproteobacteria bacterium]|nr:hypothetical protein [Deltaproteobacteria bacterium]